MTTKQRNILTTSRDYDTGLLPCSSRGVSGDGPEGGARRGVPRLRLVTATLGRFGNRPPGTMTRAARSSLHVLRRKCRSRKRGPEAENRHGGAPRGAPPSSRSRMYPTSATHRVPNSGNPSSGGRQAPSQGAWPAALLQVAGARWHPSACRRSAHPSVGWTRSKLGRFAPRERDGLFDIVSRRSPHPPSPEGGLQRTSRVATCGRKRRAGRPCASACPSRAVANGSCFARTRWLVQPTCWAFGVFSPSHRLVRDRDSGTAARGAGGFRRTKFRAKCRHQSTYPSQTS